MSNPKIDVYVLQLKMMAKSAKAEAAKVDESKRLTQATEGKAHPLWIIGHLAWSVDVIVNGILLGQKPQLPREWGKLFGPSIFGGDPVTPDAGKYPDWDALLTAYQETTDRAIEAVSGLADADLPGPVKGNPPGAVKEMFRTLETSLAGLIAHDAHHRGQMALLATL